MAPYWGRIRELIEALKYDGQTQHAAYLGHLLFQHLDRHLDRSTVDLVLPNPTDARRGIRHTELLVEAMGRADTEGRWTFDDPSRPCLVKSRPTVRAHGQDRAGRYMAADALRRALHVARPEVIAGRRILVIDDIATTAAQLDAVSRTLYEHGAASVSALVLATSELPGPSTQAIDTPTTGAPEPPDTAVGRLDALRRGPRPSSPGASL